MHHAAADDRPEIVKYLIQDVGMDANGILRLNQGEKVAAIHLAILEGEIWTKLKRRENNKKASFLLLGNTETVEKLVELGAGLTVKGEFNLNRGTPLEWAERCQKNKQLSKFARSNYDPFKPMVNLLREQVSDSRTRK